MSLLLVAVAIIAYLIGSIPFGLLLTRAAGLGDVRRIGSGNIGATNVLRTGRRDLAAATLLLDGLKGAVAVWLGIWLLPLPIAAAVAAVFAALGHCCPVWLRFAGGKGVATLLGIAFALDWRAGIICAALWLALACWTKISSVGGLGAAVALPILLFIFTWRAFPADPVPWGAILVMLLVLQRHRANIGRLFAGTEPRIGAGRA